MKTGIQKLTPMLIIILGFFTFGLSDLVWIYVISDKYDYRRFLPMKQVALTVITFGIYGIIWAHRISKAMYNDALIKEKNNVIICTLLPVLFLRNVSIYILYSALGTNSCTEGAEQ